MSTKWCPQCGAEYREGVDVCADCGVALTDRPPEDEGSDVVIYELTEWSADQRGELEVRLQAQGIDHQWETAEGADVTYDYAPGGENAWVAGTDLVVGDKDEETVDALLDEIEATRGQGLAEAIADDADDEATYEAMSHLYVAADRLKDDAGDLAVAGEFFDAADAARTIPTPFGIDPDIWQHVQQLAAEVSTALEQEADDKAVAAAAQRLRDILFDYV